MESKEQAPEAFLMRLDIYPERESLSPPSRKQEAAGRLIEEISQRCLWPAKGVILARTPEALVDLVIRTFAGPGERIAVFEPSAESYKESVLSAKAAYVDCGRTYHWKPRLDALDMVFSDGAIGVVMGHPNYPVDTDLNRISEVVYAAGKSSSVLFALMDLSRGMVKPDILVKDVPEAIYLISLCLSDGAPFFALLCDEKRADAMACIHGSFAGDLEGDLLGESEMVEQHQKWNHHQKILLSQLTDNGYQALPSGDDGAFVFAPGTDQSTLSQALEKDGYQTEFTAHHTWRGGVRVLSAQGEAS